MYIPEYLFIFWAKHLNLYFTDCDRFHLVHDKEGNTLTLSEIKNP